MDCRRDGLEMRKKEMELRDRKLIVRERDSVGERKGISNASWASKHVLIAQLKQEMQAILPFLGNKSK